MLKRQKSLARISPLACMGLFHSCLKSLERGREECLFWGGGILWLTSNFLSSRTKVAGKLHPSVLQSFHDKQIKQNVSEPESDTPELFLWADPCADLSGRVLTWAAVCWREEGGWITTTAAWKGASTLQSVWLVRRDILAPSFSLSNLLILNQTQVCMNI